MTLSELCRKVTRSEVGSGERKRQTSGANYVNNSKQLVIGCARFPALDLPWNLRAENTSRSLETETASRATTTLQCPDASPGRQRLLLLQILPVGTVEIVWSFHMSACAGLVLVPRYAHERLSEFRELCWASHRRCLRLSLCVSLGAKPLSSACEVGTKFSDIAIWKSESQGPKAGIDHIKRPTRRSRSTRSSFFDLVEVPFA